MRPAAHPLRSTVVLLSALVAVLLAATLLVWRPWSAQPAPVAVEAAVREPDAAAAAPRVLVFGDSWTYGAAASRPELGYAYQLAEVAGWETIVDGEPGSGYLKRGWYETTFGDRIAQLDPALDPDLVILQGSINDRRQGEAGYRDAVEQAWTALQRTFPDATLVVVGPAPQVLPVEPQTARIDRDLAELAAAHGLPYVSPIAESWITPQNYLEVIDTSDEGADHPSDAGHRYLAERVAEAVRPYVPPVSVEAVEDQAEPVTVD